MAKSATNQSGARRASRGAMELVPLDVQRLKEAVRRDPSGVTGVAKRARISHQTLSMRITRGSARCRRSARDALAEALDVPERWLAGETLYEFVRFDPATPAVPPGLLAEWYRAAPRLALAWVRFEDVVRVAYQRDCAGYVAAPSLLALGEQRLVGALSVLVSPPRWTLALCDPTCATVGPDDLEYRATVEQRAAIENFKTIAVAQSFHRFEEVLPPLPVRIPPREQAARLGALRALKFTLTPWLKGLIRLNYRWLGLLLRMPGTQNDQILQTHERQRQLVEAVRKADGSGVDTTDPFVPFSLLLAMLPPAPAVVAQPTQSEA